MKRAVVSSREPPPKWEWAADCMRRKARVVPHEDPLDGTTVLCCYGRNGSFWIEAVELKLEPLEKAK